MPKVKHRLKIIAYDKEMVEFGDCTIAAYTYDEIFKTYLGYLELLTEGKFTNVCRLDLVSCGRVLFTFSSLRHIVKQHNLTIKFNSL